MVIKFLKEILPLLFNAIYTLVEKLGFDLETTKKILIIYLIIIFLILAFVIGKSILKNQKEKPNEKSEPHLMRNILFITVIIFGCIALIPSPLVLMASSMSAGGGSINWTDPLEMLARIFWILTIFYPAYIALPFIFGRDMIVKRNKKIGYALVIFSGLLSIGLIIFFISIFV